MHSDFKFECVNCGKCCSDDGHVYLTTADRVKLAEHLDVSVTQFTRKYCAKTHGEYHLKEPDNDCCFLKENRCVIYDCRPEQCRTWPFWEENFYRGKLKKGAVSYCKGIRV
ncbi:YkgJ family cysteine cluster protein [Verrucomicrobiota bacterium]